MADKRKRISDRMREALFPTQPVKPSPIVETYTSPEFEIGPGEPVPEGTHHLQWLIDRFIAEDERMHRVVEPPYQGKQIQVGTSHQHLFFREYTPQEMVDRIKADPEMMQWAGEWMAPGGNRYAEIRFWDRYYEMFGTMDNPNLRSHLERPYTEYNHYFDWKKWKAEYNTLYKG